MTITIPVVIALTIYAFFGLLLSTEAGNIFNWPNSSKFFRAVFGPIFVIIFGFVVMLAGAILASPALIIYFFH